MLIQTVTHGPLEIEKESFVGRPSMRWYGEIGGSRTGIPSVESVGTHCANVKLNGKQDQIGLTAAEAHRINQWLAS